MIQLNKNDESKLGVNKNKNQLLLINYSEIRD